MASWPSDYSGAWTLAQAVERSGVGLHSGATSRVRLQVYDSVMKRPCVMRRVVAAMREARAEAGRSSK